MKESAIILFARNLTSENLKTRIASKLGKEKAVQIYKELLCITEEIFFPINLEKFVYWDTQVPNSKDFFYDPNYIHKVQVGMGLGERMENAFLETLAEYKKVIILGTDCPYLTEKIIFDSLYALDTYDYCIGPALDGGYYLLGLKKFSSKWFRNLSWSTEKVYRETLLKADEMQLVGFILPTLGDVDTEGDYYKWKEGGVGE